MKFDPLFAAEQQVLWPIVDVLTMEVRYLYRPQHRCSPEASLVSFRFGVLLLDQKELSLLLS